MQRSRWEEIAEKYRADIESGRLAPGDRLPSDAALAELLGVSRPTAHRALHELNRLGLVIRQRRWGTVVAAREQRRTGVVAFVLDQVAHQRDFPRADLVGGIHTGLGEGHNLLWCDSKLSPKREIEFLKRMSREADGILCWPTGSPESTPVIQQLVENRTPLVFLDRVPAGVEANAVMIDSPAATRRALEFLFERGHTRVAFFSFDKLNVTTVAERLATFESLCEEHGIGSSGLTRLFSPDLEFGDANRFVQAVHDALFTLLHAQEPITAVFCVQDMFAAAVLDSAEHMGVSIPDDLEIVTYNDWPSMMLRRPWHAHRIANDAFEMGRIAALRLHQLMSGVDDGPPQVLRVESEFFVADAGLLPQTSRIERPEGASTTKGG